MDSNSSSEDYDQNDSEDDLTPKIPASDNLKSMYQNINDILGIVQPKTTEPTQNTTEKIGYTTENTGYTPLKFPPVDEEDFTYIPIIDGNGKLVDLIQPVRESNQPTKEQTTENLSNSIGNVTFCKSSIEKNVPPLLILPNSANYINKNKNYIIKIKTILYAEYNMKNM